VTPQRRSGGDARGRLRSPGDGVAGAHGDGWALGGGYGLGFHATLFGIQPAMPSLDLAWPVPTSAALRERTGPPLAVHVYLTQSF